MAVGDNATIVRTENGGMSWTLVMSGYGCSHPNASFVAVRCPAAGVCTVLAMPNVVLHTINAGRSWQRHTIFLLSTLAGFTHLACPSARVCYTIAPPSGNTMTWFSHSGALYKSTDGGSSWRQSPIPGTVPCPGDCGQQSVGYALQWISCQSERNCYAGGDTFIGSHEGYASAVIRTNNGGATWTLVHSDFDPNIGTCPTTGICTGVFYQPLTPNVGPDFMRSTTRGISWTSTPIGPVLTSIACTGSTFCELAGPRGTLAMTINNRLFKQVSPTRRNLNAVACPTRKACFAVGAAGTVVAHR